MILADISNIGATFGIGIFVLLGMFLMVAIMVFWIWTLVDCARNESSEGNDKLIWILVILFAGLLGSIIYCLARRPERIRRLGR